MATLSEFDKENLSNLILGGEGDWMSANILRLIARADPGTREQFRAGFPDHVAAYEAWHSSSIDLSDA